MIKKVETEPKPELTEIKEDLIKNEYCWEFSKLNKKSNYLLYIMPTITDKTYYNLIYTLFDRHTPEHLLFIDGNIRNLSRDNVKILV